ncbi:alpha/beta fold hydrolase [Nitrogeniibacter aestuarii]|uniref:alpha/beta fold hydrolase n=1 Tax=Nitrogeniibacter aestuarii TaxID=2815343 RepID=UPI001E3EDDC0|nr:alpha/beta fold hydrolase [Nitrogeniibacter aestuarii]
MNRPLTLIHGWGMSPAVWTSLRAGFAATREVFTPALPGHDAHGDRAIDEGDWVAKLADAIPDQSAVIGWSLGGQLAMRIAIDHPHKVSRLVLVGTTPCFVQQPGWTHALDADTVTGFRNEFATDPSQTLKRFVALQAMGEADRKGLSRELGKALIPVDSDNAGTLARGLDLLSTIDLRSELSRIGCPVRIFHGSKDALMPEGAAHWLADHIESAQLTCFDDAGHAPFLSRPEEFRRLVRRFLDG